MSISLPLDRGEMDGSTPLNTNAANKHRRSINASKASAKPPWNAGPGWNGRQIPKQRAAPRRPAAISNLLSDHASSSESEDLSMPSTPTNSHSLAHLSRAHVRPTLPRLGPPYTNRLNTPVTRLKRIPPIRPTSPTETEDLWEQVRAYNGYPSEGYTESYSEDDGDQVIYGQTSIAENSRDNNHQDATSRSRGRVPSGNRSLSGPQEACVLEG